MVISIVIFGIAILLSSSRSLRFHAGCSRRFRTTVLTGAVVNLPGEESTDLAFFYLKQQLQLEDATMVKIIRSHPWILYLRVESNLKPTIKEFSKWFTINDIRSIIDRVPSVLAIDAVWTLPEKFQSLQKMFSLSRASFVTLIVAQPLLLTSSIARNLEIAEFFTEEIELTPDEIRALVLKYPQVTMTNVQILGSCWSILLTVFGLSDTVSKKLILQHPLLLSSRLLRDNVLRRKQLREVGLTPGTELCRKVILRFPQILYIDVTYFISANIQVLGKVLDLQPSDMCDMLTVFPQLLGLNPISLERSCNFVGYMLTGMTDFYNEALVSDDLAISGRKYGNKLRTNEENILTKDEETMEHSERDLDVIADIALNSQQLHLQALEVQNQLTQPRTKSRRSDHAVNEKYGFITKLKTRILRKVGRENVAKSSTSSSELSNFSELYYSKNSFPLSLSKERMVKIMMSVPWLFSYRPERSERILSTLAVSLALSRSELTRCVALYPRLFCLSVDGKISEVLRTLAEAASDYITSEDALITGSLIRSGNKIPPSLQKLMRPATLPNIDDTEFLKDLQTEFNIFGTEQEKIAILKVRKDRVRKMVRQVILKFPLVLGTSMEKIESRLLSMKDARAPWDDFVTILRRSPEKHSEWMATRLLSIAQEIPVNKF